MSVKKKNRIQIGSAEPTAPETAYCKDRQQADPIANPKSSHINTQTQKK
jgi:hypothetical protein